MKNTNGPNIGLILAAGQGRRFGGPKQFHAIHGQPVLIYSISAFNRCWDVSFVVVVTNRARIDDVQHLLRSRGLRKVAHVVAGGQERGDSVERGLAVLPEQGWVAIHDAARPVITPRMISDGFRACHVRGPLTYGCELADTVKRVRGERIVETLDRAELIAVQTPQFFPIALLRQAYEAARKEHVTAGDDCALVERLGVDISWLPGPRTNIKITTPEDLKLCTALL